MAKQVSGNLNMSLLLVSNYLFIFIFIFKADSGVSKWAYKLDTAVHPNSLDEILSLSTTNETKAGLKIIIH